MLKKLFVIVLSVMALESIYAQSSNPIVRRLSNQEIAEGKTPSAIAYNFINSILQKDFPRMIQYLDLSPRELQEIDEYMQEHGETYETLCRKEEYVVGILSWLPVLNKGYEIVVANIEDFWLAKTDDGWMVDPEQIVKDGMVYIPGEEKPYVGIHQKRVYVTCSPSSEVNILTFDDVSRYKDTQVKVILRLSDNRWMVESCYFTNQYKRELIEGKWYLQEVQIQENEDYIDGVVYDKDKCIVFYSATNEETIEEPVLDEDMIDSNSSDNSAVDSVEWNNLVRELSMLSGVDYEILNDTILVLSFPQGYSETIYVKETYEIKKLTKDLLVLATDKTPQGYMIFIYGRKEQSIKYTKHSVVK